MRVVVWSIMDQFKEISLLESLLNFQKDVFYSLTVNCSMQLTILYTCLSLCLTLWFAKLQMRPYTVWQMLYAFSQWNFFKLVHNERCFSRQYNNFLAHVVDVLLYVLLCTFISDRTSTYKSIKIWEGYSQICTAPIMDHKVYFSNLLINVCMDLRCNYDVQVNAPISYSLIYSL